jgi:hypothetical protein
MMNITLQIRYYTKVHEWLCFSHAAKLAVEGNIVDQDIDDFSSEYYMGTTTCVICQEEYDKKYAEEQAELESRRLSRPFKQSFVGNTKPHGYPIPSTLPLGKKEE